MWPRNSSGSRTRHPPPRLHPDECRGTLQSTPKLSLFPPYPFVNVYKRFIYGYRPFLFPISPHESENQEHTLGRNPLFFHHPSPWHFHQHRLLLSAKRLFLSMAHRTKHRSCNNLFHPHFSLPFPPHLAKLRCTPALVNIHFSPLESLPTTVEEIRT